MIRLKYGGLLLAAILFFTFTITASAQYSFQLQVKVYGDCYGAGTYLNNVTSSVRPTFTTKAECEAARAAANARHTVDGCTVVISTTPCVGSPLPGAAEPGAGTGTIYKGSGSTYSASPANEVKDWAKDNTALTNIIGGQNSNQFRTVQTGDEKFDELTKEDIEDFFKEEEEKKPEEVKDDRPGFDEDAFRGTFKSLGTDNHSDDFVFVDVFKSPNIPAAPKMEVVSTEVHYVPDTENFISEEPKEEDESFIKKKYNQFTEWLDESESVRQAKDLASNACESMTWANLSKGLSPMKGGLVKLAGTISGVADFGKFYKNYTMDLFDNFKDKTMEAVRTGKVPDYNLQEFKDRADTKARESVAGALTGGTYSAAWGR